MYKEVCSFNDMFIQGLNVKGPIEVTERSHPFSSIKYARKSICLEDFGYVEEEYFISGFSNVYDLDDGDALIIKKEKLPFETRILVRRPENAENRKNRVILDIMNASNGYDIEDQWRRSYLYIMENNFSYIGLTSKPVNVLALKNFDYERYKTLNWANGELSVSPGGADDFQRIDGCEEGLVWDMITQLGGWIQGEGKKLFTDEEKLYVYLTGQSQSGMYLNTYINQFHTYLKYNDKSVFDGYLSLVSGGYQRALCQSKGNDSFMCIRNYPNRNVDIPFITMSSEGDFPLFQPIKGVVAGINSDGEENKKRYYEVAGAPHTDAASPLVPLNSEIEKAKCKKRILDGEYTYRLNDFPLDYIINGLLEKLHVWAKQGIAPPIIDAIENDGDHNIVRDKYGNAKGGIRTAFLEVPKARYVGSIGLGETNGTMEFFSEEIMKQLYGTFDEYLAEFEAYGKKQLNDGDITKNDLRRMLDWARSINR